MSRGFLRRAIIVCTATLVLAFAFSRSAYAAAGAGASGGSGGAYTIDIAAAAGSAVGVLATYLGLMNWIAYRRNPLRGPRRRARPALTGARPQGYGARDVSAHAQSNRKIAVRRLVVQMTGLCLVAYGADVFLVPYWYVYLMIGLAVVWAGGRFIYPAELGRAKNRAILAGSRRIRVTVMLSVASALVILGLISCVTYGVFAQQPQDAVLNMGSATVPAQTAGAPFFLIGFTLVALGAIISRRARRLGTIEAHRLMLRDRRPPVLYLRSFGDDQLKLWTATLGRPSLIERFTPRRFDAFEEVLVRHLSRYGPVIALNPPGTKLAPLGAARETIDSADWQSIITTWMEQSSLIVFVTPPERVTQGLLWELENVSANNHWDKTLVIVPPVPPEHLQQRWRALRDACARLWPFTFSMPTEDPNALVLTFTSSQWTAITADRRTEWSYSAALTQALDDPRRQAPAAGSPPASAPRAGARPRLTPPVTALIVLLVAAAAATGSIYAVRNASPASTTDIAASSTPGNSSPQPSGPGPTASGSQPPPPSTGQQASPGQATPGQQASPANGLVSLAPAAAQYPDADSIASVITEYFQAINDRDYAAYLATQSPDVALTSDQFQTGYRSTEDSSVLVTNITTAPDGRPEADVTFTSQQQPQDGPDGESCTNWQISMFFDDNAGTYIIGAPPADYRASHQPCS